MFTFFLLMAVVGGTVFLTQFVMALIGMGGEDLIDGIPEDLPDDLPIGDPQGSFVDHGSTWFFGVISFRTAVAFMTFFGLAGIAAMQAGSEPVVSILIAVAAGLAAMYGVHFLMRSMHHLRHDGTVNIGRALGQRGTVYLPIPAAEAGNGKVQLRMQGRLAEYAAVTSGDDELPTGTTIVVTEIVSPTTLRVESVSSAREVAQA